MSATRAEHIAWARKRALEYVEAGELTQAVTSMLSDLGKHPETTPPLAEEGMAVLLWANGGDAASVRLWIERFR